MSVRKDKRNQSKMDFFKYADRINEQLTLQRLKHVGFLYTFTSKIYSKAYKTNDFL